MELVSKAIIFATQAHDGMRRRQEKSPYILHPMEAAAIVGSITNSQEVIAAAALHDVVEDAGISMQEIEAHFGKRVAELVASETENKRVHLPPETTWKVRKEEAIQILESTKDLDIKILYLGDKLSNMRAFYRNWLKEGNGVWQHFDQKDPVQQAWYYRSIADNTRELSNTPAWQEYHHLIQIIFAEVST